MESVGRKKFNLVRPRTIVLTVLLVLPVLVYAIVGTVAVWQLGWMMWLWWVIPAFWVLTWGVARFWPAAASRERDSLDSEHWTPRDNQAAEIVKQFQTQVDDFTPAQLTDPHLYLNQAQSLAKAMATHYHPTSTDPLSSLTMPEILAAFRLVADDLEGLMLNSVPGSRLLTIGQWKKLGGAPKWIRSATSAIWAASILINPLNIARYGTSRVTSDRVVSGVQTELLMTMYLRFIRQVGFYLIEMNSGRLRGGADAYRAAFDRNSRDKFESPANAQSNEVNIAIVGQTSAGKSSLINALMGTSGAAVDILPTTNEVQHYRFQLDQHAAALNLLDTPGYGQAGATASQQQHIQTALETADAVLLVLDAHSPARQADRLVLESVQRHYQARPQLKPPPVIAVLTQIDLLSPALEWAPPYDWQQGISAKEKSIAGAVAYTNEILAGQIVDAVPVCTADAASRRWGVIENLVPALMQRLDQARAGAVLAAFEDALNKNHVKIFFKQAKESGKQILKNWLSERR